MGNLDKSLLFKKGKVTIQGMDAMVAAFRELTGNKANGKMVTAMRYALKPLYDAVKIKAPIKRKGETLGLLKKSIGIKVKQMGRRGKKKIVGMVGPKMKTVRLKGHDIIPYKYAHLVERGSAPHSLRSIKHAQNIDFMGPVHFESKKQNRNSGMHPGAKAKPFLAPALASTGNQIYTRFCEKIKEIVKTIALTKGK